MLSTLFLSVKTIYMLSLGWLLHPDEYERYYMAWHLVRHNREWVDNNLLKNNKDPNIVNE